jgi:tellurite resistance protein
MIPFSITTPMTAKQVVAATNALLQVARVDEACTQAEVDLIRTFYESFSADEAMPAFDTLLGQNAGMATDANVLLSNPEHREFVVGACVMVAYADGQLSDAETKSIHGVGRALGVSTERIGEIIDVVRDHLLSQFARLPDSGSVAKVAQELS